MLNLSDKELKLLNYANEHCAAPKMSSMLHAERIQKDLQVSQQELEGQASHLQGLGLLEYDGRMQQACSTLWITPEGRECCRELEAAPGLVKKQAKQENKNRWKDRIIGAIVGILTTLIGIALAKLLGLT